ncbi:olfactory receptor 2AT4-like [Gadus chalcogrammus]|uniref:olfactory receptor 2AT4-like n=1 Tax=Gadus chalcogrammus TaxID=1042646 RepID=UPI0024C4D831|nr:olfactory receptor 2AT4-like [Gadus chalcogrammus]
MNLHNGSIQITEFFIGGFEKVERQMEIGFVMLVVYVLIIVANTLNIVFIILDKKLHKPMYLLICNLAVVDILISSSSCPTMIGVLLAGANTISYAACLIQMFSFQVAEAMEMFALAVMALDRLIAISFPLRYHSILTNARTIAITYFLWVAACAFVTLMPVLLIPIPYCFNRLRYSFCDYPAIIRTSCHDPKHFFNLATIVWYFLLFFTFSFICISYACIISVVLRSSKNESRKVLGTCLSHLIVVVCYYVPLFMGIVFTRIGLVLTLEEQQGLTIGAILGPSLVNPFVYCLRTKEIKNKLFGIFKKVKPI